MPSSIIDKISHYKVSSVLNDDRKVYGKKFLFDGKAETCWNSDQGTPQWISFQFDQSVTLTGIKLQFQGGFAGKTCELGVRSDPEEEEHQIGLTSENKNDTIYQFTPQDTNSLQEFTFPNIFQGNRFYLKFCTSTDFYGRIILYNFDILGEVE